jgi:hypothetical protein
MEERPIYDRNKNKTYYSNLNAQRISILMSNDENPSPLLGVPYEILMDCENNNMKKCTSQNKKPTTQPSTVALGIRIRGLNFVLKNNCSTFLCFSAIVLCETKISEKSPTVKKRWCLIEFNDKKFNERLRRTQYYQQVICEGPSKKAESARLEKLGMKSVSDQLVVDIVTDIVFFTDRGSAKFVLVEEHQKWWIVTTCSEKIKDWVLIRSNELICFTILRGGVISSSVPSSMHVSTPSMNHTTIIPSLITTLCLWLPQV